MFRKEECKKIKSFLIEYSDYFLFVLCIFFVDSLIRFLTNIAFGNFPILFICVSLLIFVIPMLFIDYKYRKIILIISVAFLSFYGFSQVVYYSFFNRFYSFKQISVSSELINILPEARSKLDFIYILFLVPIILCVVYYILRKKYVIGKGLINVKLKYIAVVVSFFLMSLGIIVINKKFDDDFVLNDLGGDRALHETFNSTKRYFQRFGIVDYVFNDAYHTLTQARKIQLSEEEIDEINKFINENSKSTSNNMTGIYEGKNLVFVLCESLNYFGLEEEITPTLYKIVHEGTLFTNNYAPIFQTATGDSEFIAQTSMMPSIDYGVTAYDFSNNHYPYSIANLFKQKGYHVNSYHSYLSYYYNREEFHKTLGYEQFYDLEKLGLDSSEIVTFAVNWIDDAKLFYSTIENTPEEPFFDFVITTSMHGIYNQERYELAYDYATLPEKYNDLADEAKWYLASQIKLNNGLDTLLESLKRKDVLDNTIIILFGDHYPYVLGSKEGYDELIGYDDYRRYQTPVIIYDPCKQGDRIDSLTSLFDLYPTICNLFNLDNSKAYMVGRDVYSNDNPKVLFFDHSILTEDFYYNATNNSLIPLNDSFNKEEAEEFISKCDSIFTYSQKILASDFYSLIH